MGAVEAGAGDALLLTMKSEGAAQPLQLQSLLLSGRRSKEDDPHDMVFLSPSIM